mmetsp:Transcript_9115/g.16548  ORF Transcript_9115/g.16548 Transcript_9115/m.16548 type:complete len:172 (+) Transcript_9115:130-645(+)
MNNISDSPGQSNEAVGSRFTPAQNSAGSLDNNFNKKPSVSARFLVGEDLQKIRHSSHRSVARLESMEEDDQDNVIKDLLYPALEGSSSRGMDLDFFEEDYALAQAAVPRHDSASSNTTSPYSSYTSNSSSINSSANSFPSGSLGSLNSYAPWPRRGQGYSSSDVTSEKLRR